MVPNTKLLKKSTATEHATSSSQPDPAASTDDVSLLPLTELPKSTATEHASASEHALSFTSAPDQPQFLNWVRMLEAIELKVGNLVEDIQSNPAEPTPQQIRFISTLLENIRKFEKAYQRENEKRNRRMTPVLPTVGEEGAIVLPPYAEYFPVGPEPGREPY